MKTIRFYGVFLIIAILLFGIIPPAAATPPTVWTMYEEVVNTPRPDIVCDGTMLIQNSIYEVRVTTFFDNDGYPVRATFHESLHGFPNTPTLFNPTNGKSWSHTIYRTQIVDLTSGTTRIVGLQESVSIPGVGVVGIDSGQLTLDAAGNITFEAGPHPMWHLGDGYANWEAVVAFICSYLG